MHKSKMNFQTFLLHTFDGGENIYHIILLSMLFSQITD